MTKTQIELTDPEEQFYYICLALLEMSDDYFLDLFLETPNPHLVGNAPWYLIETNQSHAVYWLVRYMQFYKSLRPRNFTCPM